MAYTYDQMLRILTRQVPKNIVEDHGSEICNLATQEVWRKYDWRETLKTLPPFYLIPNQQDYGAPFVSVPTDFYGIRQAYYSYLGQTPTLRRMLKVVKDLQLTTARAIPSSICYNPDTSSFRVFPRVPEGCGAPNYMIDGTYKKLPTAITTSNMTSTLPIAPMYFQMWLSGFLWAGKMLMGDPGAGQSQYGDGQVSYTGYLANFQLHMDRAAESEGLELGDPTIAPSEPLIWGTFNQGIGYRGAYFF